MKTPGGPDLKTAEAAAEEALLWRPQSQDLEGEGRSPPRHRDAWPGFWSVLVGTVLFFLGFRGMMGHVFLSHFVCFVLPCFFYMILFVYIFCVLFVCFCFLWFYDGLFLILVVCFLF